MHIAPFTPHYHHVCKLLDFQEVATLSDFQSLAYLSFIPPLTNCSHFSSDLHESQNRVLGRLGAAAPFCRPPGPVAKLMSRCGSSPDPLAGFRERNRERGMETAREGQETDVEGKEWEGKGRGKWKLGGVCVTDFRGIDLLVLHESVLRTVAVLFVVRPSCGSIK